MEHRTACGGKIKKVGRVYVKSVPRVGRVDAPRCNAEAERLDGPCRTPAIADGCGALQVEVEASHRARSRATSALEIAAMRTNRARGRLRITHFRCRPPRFHNRLFSL